MAYKMHVFKYEKNSVFVKVLPFRCAVFRIIKRDGTIKDSDLNHRFTTGEETTGRVTSTMINEARKVARVAINKKRRAPKRKKKFV